jgi:hypothetical protein
MLRIYFDDQRYISAALPLDFNIYILNKFTWLYVNVGYKVSPATRAMHCRAAAWPPEWILSALALF